MHSLSNRNEVGPVITDLDAGELEENGRRTGLAAEIAVTGREREFAEETVGGDQLQGTAQQGVVHGALLLGREGRTVPHQLRDGPEEAAPVNLEEIGLVGLAVDSALYRLQRVPVERRGAQQQGAGRPEGNTGIEGQFGPVVQVTGILELGLVAAVEFHGQACRPAVGESITQRPLERIRLPVFRPCRGRIAVIEIDRVVLGIHQDGSAHVFSAEIRPVNVAEERNPLGNTIEGFRSGRGLVAVRRLRQGDQPAIGLVKTDRSFGNPAIPSCQGGRIGQVEHGRGGLDKIIIPFSARPLRGTSQGATEREDGKDE